jgi:signal transduction histidine kinase
VAAAIDLKALQTAFPDENLYEHSAIYLVSDDGSSIYHDPSSSYQGVEVANVFQALEQRNFVAGGTVDDLKIAVGNSQLTAMQFERDDGLWYVASAPSQETELSVLLFSPEEAIDITDNTAIAELILLFIAFVLCVVVLALVLISIEYKIRVNRQLRSGQNGAIVVEDSRPLSIISPEDNFPSDKDYDSPTYIEAKSNYLSKVTKDIQDPVNGIIGLTNNALQNQNDVSGLEDCLYKISGTSNKLISLVNDVLDMSRLESGAALMEKSKFNLLSLVDNCAAMVGGKLIMRKIPFEADIAHFEHKEVVGDEMRLRRILLNFLNCAEKLCVDGGSMTFRATEVSSDETVARYRFVIDERGGGMSEQCLSHIFEPFTLQEDETGLGLTVAKRFAELMGGSVTVTSELGKGSVFTVELGLSIDNGTEVFPASFEEQPIESDKLS